MISQELKDRIREANDIVDIISQYVSLKQAGKTFKGLCPFHQEKTPSFIVNPDKQFYHCFGCGAGGDVFEFMMRKEGLSFMEALRQLAQKARIPLPDQEDSEAGAEADRIRRQLYQVMAWAAERFRQAYRNPKAGKEARDYLASRKLAPETIERFGLGWAPVGWDNLIKAGRRDHYSEELLERAGLIVARDKGPGHYDRFRERVMFPIADVQGRVIAFGGRLIKPGEPKYLNSPETDLFRKGDGLYALNLARDRARERDRLVLVEGYMDVITCHAAGVTEAVASLGTALTPAQAGLVKRYVSKVILIYDMDAAGIKAALRAFEILNQHELAVKAVSLEGAKDPDEYIRAKGAKKFEEALGRALGMPEFVYRAAAGRHDPKTVDGKIAIKNEVAAVIAQLREGIERQEACRMLAERLRQDERLIAEEVAKLRRHPGSAAVTAVKTEAPAPESKPAAEEELLLSILLRFPEEIARCREELRPDYFHSGPHRELLEEVLKTDGPVPDAEERWLPDFMGRLADPGLVGVAARMAAMDRGEQEPGAVIRDCLKRMEKNQVIRELEEIQMRIKEVQQEGDMEMFKHLAQKKRELASRLKKLGVHWKSGF